MSSPRPSPKPTTKRPVASKRPAVRKSAKNAVAGAGASTEQEWLRSLIMHAPACISVLVGPDLMYELANPDYCKLFNLDQSIIGKKLADVMPDVDQELMKTIKRVGSKGERYVTNERPITIGKDTNGQPVIKYFNLVYEPIFDERHKPNGLMVFANDVSEQVRARKRIAESEERLRFMAESMPQMIFTLLPDGKPEYLNKQWEYYSGIPLDELITNKKAFMGIIHPDDQAGYMQARQQSLMSGQPSEYEYRLRRYDGVYRWHINRVNPQKDADGNVVLWIGSNTDTDDMKRAVQKEHALELETAMLTEQRRQLLQLNQAKDEFISLASHQLRTPATGVKQYIGMLLQGYIGDISKEQRAFLQTAYESNERQLAIVNDLLQVAQVDAGKVRLQKSRTELAGMVRDILNEQAAAFEKRHQKVVFKQPKGKVYVQADEDRIRMVLENIIDNASKYTPDGRNISVRLTSTSKAVKVIVKDQGVGIDMADIAKIFNKFSRLDNPLTVTLDGSGLGLYWAKKIMDLHEGSIDVTSEVGKGSTFTIVLPAATKPASRVITAKSGGANGRRRAAIASRHTIPAAQPIVKNLQT